MDDDTRTLRERISAEAVDWFLKFQDAARTEPDTRAFSDWLLRSPAHIEEYLTISCAWGALNVANEGAWDTESLIAAAQRDSESEADNVVRLHDHGGRHPTLPRNDAGRRRIPRMGWAALAASLVLGAGLWVGYAGWHSAATFETAIGEQRSVTLQDGTVVFLNTDSKVQVRWTPAERHIDLIRGEARFQVARNPTRPFVVATSKAAVRAVGTIFNVRADPLDTQVAVMEGQVEVMAVTRAPQASEPDGRPPGNSGGSTLLPHASWSIRLAAGERAAVTSRGIEANVGPPIERVEAWTERRLVFRDEPLGVVVAEFNRYRTQPLILDDPQLAALKMSGAFDLSDPESLITYLKTFETVRVEHPRDGSEHLTRGASVSAGRN